MKLLKGSLVALVAILAVGLTVAMQAGAFEKAARVGECYLSAVVLDDEAACQQLIIDDVDPCSISTTIAGDPLFSLGNTFSTDPSADCIGTTKFCCLEIVANATQQCNQPTIDPAGPPAAARYRVASVFCKN